MLDADRHELREIAGAYPDRKPPRVDRLGIHVSQPHAEHLHAVLIGVKAAEHLAEHLRDAVAAVRLRIDTMIDRLVAAVKAHCLIAGGEEYPFDAVHARGLEYVVAADNVRFEDRRPRPLHRVASE